MYCEQCGKEMDQNARFCDYCGAAVVQGGAAVMQGSPAPAGNGAPDKKESNPKTVIMLVGIVAGVVLILGGAIKVWSITQQSRDPVPPAVSDRTPQLPEPANDLLTVGAAPSAGTAGNAQDQGNSGKPVGGKPAPAQGGSSSAAPAKTVQDFSEAAARLPDIGDFDWFNSYLKDGTLPAGAERFYDASLAEGNWLMVMYTYSDKNPKKWQDYVIAQYLNVVVSTQGTDASATLKWYLAQDTILKETYDDRGVNDLVLTGAWDAGYQKLEAKGEFVTLILQEFYQTADAQYAIGAMERVSGDYGIVGLVRRPDAAATSDRQE